MKRTNAFEPSSGTQAAGIEAGGIAQALPNEITGSIEKMWCAFPEAGRRFAAARNLVHQFCEQFAQSDGLLPGVE
jgi:hypothetical protein